MPSPHKDTSNTRISYTRWEPLGDEEDDDKDNSTVEFHRFEEEPGQNETHLHSTLSTSFRAVLGSSVPGKRFFMPGTLSDQPRPGSSRRSANSSTGVSASASSTKCWNIVVRSLSFMLIFCLGWITGFVVRWGVHHFYIDPNGHCVTPVPYRYLPEMVREMMDEISEESIEGFWSDFVGMSSSSQTGHSVGSSESGEYASKISDLFIQFGFFHVDIDSVNEMISQPSATMPPEISIRDSQGNVVWSKAIPSAGHVAYSANAIGEGRLTYGHFGRISDFHDLQNRHNLSFVNATVILKTSQLHHSGAMVRNAELFGAKAVILFPDPISYILTRNGIVKLPENASLGHSVKFVPGDPSSPFVSSSEYATLPTIPVVSISYEEAKVLLMNFTNAYNIDKKYWYSLPLKTLEERNYSASVEVHSPFKSATLHNVIATIPGRYEPTRYVIIGSHHDVWYQGDSNSKPSVGHSVLMELARTLGYFYGLNWMPGRSLIFASWDGGELGNLGSTSWLYRHSKELSSRGVVYINLDHLIQGAEHIHISGSPLLRTIMELAAKSVPCHQPEGRSDPNDTGGASDHQAFSTETCTIYSKWLQSLNMTESTDYATKESKVTFPTGFSEFQSILGISSLEVSLLSKPNENGDGYPFVHLPSNTTRGNLSSHQSMGHPVMIAKFLVIMLMQLISSPQLTLSAQNYAEDIKKELQEFALKSGDVLVSHGISIKDIQDAAEGFEAIAQRFHTTFNPIQALELLSYHEFNDQLMELERSFMLPSFASTHPNGSPLQNKILSGSFRHVIHGPSPLNPAQLDFFPRLSAALEVAKEEDTEQSWNGVVREAFFVVDALKSATCVLDNHLVSLPESLSVTTSDPSKV